MRMSKAKLDQMDLKYGIKLCITVFSNNEVTIDLERVILVEW